MNEDTCLRKESIMDDCINCGAYSSKEDLSEDTSILTQIFI